MNPFLKQATEEIKGKKEHPTSLLLAGTRGCPMTDDAKEAASFLLGVEEKALSAHPDYMLITLQDGEKTIGVEAAEEILHRASNLPAAASYIVVVIDGIEKMTPQAQNKLLKLLEEAEHLLIIAAMYEDGILPTVKSRMRVIHYRPLSFEAYCNALGDSFNREDALVRYHATGGYLGAAPDAGVEECFFKISRAINAGDPKELFSALHLVKEKDPENFFEKHREDVPPAYALMGALLMGKLEEDTANKALLSCIRRLSEHGRESTTTAYTKDLFFSCVALVAETLDK